MLKLLDALARVDRSQGSSWVDFEPLQQALRITDYPNIPTDYETRVQSYWLIKWMCTDTWVGLRAIYFDNQLAGMIWQDARKNDPEVKFISHDRAHLLRKYLMSAVPEPEFAIIPETEEISDTYHVTYGSELLVDQGIYNEQPVTVNKSSIVHGYDGDPDSWSKIKVRSTNSEEVEIDLEDFHIPLHLQK